MYTKKEKKKMSTSSSSSSSPSSSSSEFPEFYRKKHKSNYRIEQTIRKIIESYKIDIEKYKEESDNEIKNQFVNIDDVKKEIEKVKIDFITVIGIFVSIFTFISIEIQILRYVCDFFRIAGFSLIIFGSLFSFIILLHSIVSEQKIKRTILFFSFSFSLFLLGIVLGSVPYIFEINNSCIVTEKNITEMECRIKKLENQKNNPDERIKIEQNSPKLESKNQEINPL